MKKKDSSKNSRSRSRSRNRSRNRDRSRSRSRNRKSYSSSSKWCKKCRRKFKGKKCLKNHQKKERSRGKHKTRADIEDLELKQLIKKGRKLFHSYKSPNKKDPYDNLRKLNEIRDALPGPKYGRGISTQKKEKSSQLIIKPILHGRRKTKQKEKNVEKVGKYFFLD